MDEGQTGAGLATGNEERRVADVVMRDAALGGDPAGDGVLGLDRAVAGEIWTSERAHADLEALCDTFGHRFAGSAGERGAPG